MSLTYNNCFEHLTFASYNIIYKLYKFENAANFQRVNIRLRYDYVCVTT